MRTRIKFCGITREQDARAAISLGVDALGFMFYDKSKRFVTPEQLAWLRQLPAFTQCVGVFVNPTEAWVHEVTQNLPIDCLQFHGDESPEFCEQFNQRYIKAVPMENLDQQGAIDYMNRHQHASGFLLDNYGANEMGGSGHAFDWQLIPNDCPAPLILAGGITVDNIHLAIQSATPHAVDLSSAIEDQPGIKSQNKMQRFVQALQRADSEQ